MIPNDITRCNDASCYLRETCARWVDRDPTVEQWQQARDEVRAVPEQRLGRDQEDLGVVAPLHGDGRPLRIDLTVGTGRGICFL